MTADRAFRIAGGAGGIHQAPRIAGVDLDIGLGVLRDAGQVGRGSEDLDVLLRGAGVEHDHALVGSDRSLADEVLEHRAFYIIGEVADPGPYPYSGGMRVINAVAMAGGFTYRAVEDEFVIQRDGQALAAGKETPVFPGDVIEVHERFF